MIVKIKSKTDKTNLNGWIFYDGLSRVHYDFVPADSVKSYEINATWVDEDEEAIGNTALLVRALKNGQEFLIITNRTTYLLNDEGKTIERLN